MSGSQQDMATQPAQSLPSFAQTFGTPSLSRVSDVDNALPPLQTRASQLGGMRKAQSARSSPQPSTLEPKRSSRKRLHAETLAAVGNSESSESDGRRSPRSVRIKEEADHDTLPPSQSRPGPSSQPPSIQGSKPTPPPLNTSSSPNPSKKRRVTISGISHPINTDVRRPSIDSAISPVVMGFTIMRDDPAALEQVRSMISVKQKQKALIEQRRGSTAGIVTPIAPPAVNIVNPPQGTDERLAQPPTKPPARAGGRSPNAGAGSLRRATIAAPPAGPIQSAPPNPRPQSPPPPVISQPPPAPADSQPPPPPQAHLHPSGSLTHTAPPPPSALPAPPVSFARRRAGIGGGKGKPADIVISPRDAQSDNHLQPLIQSAPPISRAGQGQAPSGRYHPSMALPSLPPVMGPGQSTKRITSGQVPPTPTRLGMPRGPGGGSGHLQPTPGGVPGRSPPSASVPISTTLVPPTPASLHHPGYAGEKSAFLAPFEMFYDALNDSKQLKNWLSDQLQKSNALVASLQRQQEQMEEAINTLVDKKVSAMREEVYGLRVRVDELEHALRATTRGQVYSPSLSATKGKVKANGYQMAAGMVPETYTFPPVDPPARRPEHIGRVPSPRLERDSEPRSIPSSRTGTPVSFEVGRRLSVSAMRLDPPRPPPQSEGLSTRSSFSAQHPHSHSREGTSHVFPPPPTAGGKGGWSPHSNKVVPPTSSTRSSLSHTLSTERSGLSRRSPGQGQRFSGTADTHYPSSGLSGDGRFERARGSESSMAQRRNSIATPAPSRLDRPTSPLDDG